ncbi:hypothetical protein BIFADO_01562 [Bifidobacterium adolescentis L2-32]|uniref:Uncharacterized protein n=1 Tax=Bifidobacterium adolescentis L2-32 TaxID=411481 RepID=A7A6S9_BIFAD|nr:hypothetical protein BIFADO_01562 [Bifidobacterium adolescentis L2-32]
MWRSALESLKAADNRVRRASFRYVWLRTGYRRLVFCVTIRKKDQNFGS